MAEPNGSFWHWAEYLGSAAIPSGYRATVIVDKTVASVTEIADRIVILVKDEIVFEGSRAELRAKPELMHRHLGV